MKKKRLGTNPLIMILACIALLTVGIVLLFFSLFAIYQVYDIEMAVEISDKSGFNTDTDMLNFGKARPSNSNSRTIVMSHEYKKPLLVHFKKTGNISRFVDLPDDFYLEPGLTKEIVFTSTIPNKAAQGNYSGTLTVYLRRI
ncbi:hypothetical protein ACFL3V_03170 [Nanoarchaeota archaeon]